MSRARTDAARALLMVLVVRRLVRRLLPAVVRVLRGRLPRLLRTTRPCTRLGDGRLPAKAHDSQQSDQEKDHTATGQARDQGNRRAVAGVGATALDRTTGLVAVLVTRVARVAGLTGLARLGRLLGR